MEKYGKGQRGKYLDEENIFLAEEKKNEEEKREKYLEKEDLFWRRRRKQRRKWMNIFGKGKYFVGGGK